MNDEVRVEDHDTRLCALPSLRKAGVRPGKRNARLLAVGLRRAGTVTDRSFVGRGSKGDDGWIGVKTSSEGMILRRRQPHHVRQGRNCRSVSTLSHRPELGSKGNPRALDRGRPKVLI
jgi:hypothetical protein